MRPTHRLKATGEAVFPSGYDPADIELLTDATWNSRELARIEAELLKQVDRGAGIARQAWLTDLPGQERVYSDKEIEAYLLETASNPVASDFPLLSSEAAASGLTLAQVAAEVKAAALAERAGIAVIEAHRSAAKRAIRAAVTEAGKRAAAVVDWSSLISSPLTNWPLSVVNPASSGGGSGTPGPQGAKGDRGDVGPAGDTGAAGQAGAQGPQGQQGIQGPAGVTGITRAFKPTDEGRLNATMANDAALVLPVVAAGIYAFTLRLGFNIASAAADAKYQINVPAGATLRAALTSTPPTALVFGAGVPQTVLVNAVGDYLVAVEGLLIVGATAGNVQLQWAQNTLTLVTPTTLRAGSFLELTKLN